jgi:hypothetical protein
VTLVSTTCQDVDDRTLVASYRSLGVEQALATKEKAGTAIVFQLQRDRQTIAAELKRRGWTIEAGA